MANNEIKAKRYALLRAKRQLIVESRFRPTFILRKAFL